MCMFPFILRNCPQGGSLCSLLISRRAKVWPEGRSSEIPVNSGEHPVNSGESLAPRANKNRKPTKSIAQPPHNGARRFGLKGVAVNLISAKERPLLDQIKRPDLYDITILEYITLYYII